MPRRPPSACQHCGALIYSGRCGTCTPRSTGSNYWRATSNAGWERLRNQHLADNPYCAKCGALATQVDHILALSLGGRKVDPANVQSLCDPCHVTKTIEDVKKLKMRVY